MNSPVHVAYCFDKGYQQHFGASLMSLLLNYTESADQLTVHIVTDAIDNEFSRKIKQLGQTFRAKFEIYQPSPQMIAESMQLPLNMASTPHVSSATYFRILLGDILPNSIGKVLYLDSDTIVMSSIHDLYSMDLGNHILAGASDFSAESMKIEKKTSQYVNTGVLLIDLAGWRENSCRRRCVEYASSNKDNITFGDQCILNAVLERETLLLNSKWNKFILSNSKEKEVEGADILHYITKNKPWQSWYSSPAKKYYWRYLDCSPWSGALPDEPSTVDQALLFARSLHWQGKTEQAVEVYENVIKSIYRSKRVS